MSNMLFARVDDGSDWDSFADRHEAGRALAARLQDLKDQDPVVLALPRGGVPVGYEIAQALNAPLDLILVRKIGVPFQPELAYAAVVGGTHPELVINQQVAREFRLPYDMLLDARESALQEIARRRRLYLGDRPQPSVTDRTAIIVDDGIATGSTMRAAIRAIRRSRPKKLVVAAPVAPPETLAALRCETDALVCLLTPGDMPAIGVFYDDFHQLSDDEVIALLNQAQARGEDRGGSKSS